MVVTTTSTITPPPTCDNYKTKKCIWGIFEPTVTLALDLLTPKFDTFILAQSPLKVKVWSNSVNRYPK